MLIEAAKKNTMGMIVTSHFSQVIEDMANRALLLVDGEIASIGSPKSVIRAFAEDYHEFEEQATVELGGKILSARDVTKKYVSVDRGVVRGGELGHLRCPKERDLRYHREERGGQDHALPDHLRDYRAHERRDERPDRRRLGGT